MSATGLVNAAGKAEGRAKSRRAGAARARERDALTARSALFVQGAREANRSAGEVANSNEADA